MSTPANARNASRPVPTRWKSRAVSWAGEAAWSFVPELIARGSEIAATGVR